MTQPPSYRHDLGNGLYLDAFSLDPNIGQEKLEEIVQSADGKARPNLSLTTITHTDHLNSLAELTLEPQEGKYQVPEPLRAYREVIHHKVKTNGPTLLPTGEIRFPLKIMQGWYYDFAATKLTNKPGELLPEVYDPSKTVEDILLENGFSIKDKSAYFALAHLMNTSNGEEIMLVQRAKGMGIAEDCISIPGSTPDLVLNKPGLKKPGFDIEHWWSHHMAEEMRDEYNLRWGDFWTGTIPIFDDKRSLPAGIVNVYTELSAAQIAEKAYGDPRVLKEHTVFYSMVPEAIPVFLQRFPIFSPVDFILDQLFAKK